jgi:hypothetical protein
MVLRIWISRNKLPVLMSEAAIKRARNVYANEKNVDFIVDDILNSKLKENQFDYIFDLCSLVDDRLGIEAAAVIFNYLEYMKRCN